MKCVQHVLAKTIFTGTAGEIKSTDYYQDDLVFVFGGIGSDFGVTIGPC